MYTDNHQITFEKCDLPFVQKHGLSKAVAIYTAHREQSSLPFVQDFHQLAGLLGCSTQVLFHTLRRVNSAYREVHIKKSSGGIRTLQVPTAPLKPMQNTILRRILDHLPVSPYATAYHRDARLRDNARPHQQKKYLLKMDLEDFFGSVSFEQVLSCVFHSGRFPTHIGVALTTLCCKDNALPQGASTSPAISNLVLKHFDAVMGSWCEKQGFSYTRYCDDITISGNRPLFVAYRKAVGMLENMGFSLNEKKTRFITAANRQTVTGLTVNQGIGVSADYKRQLRQDVYYALRFSPEDHIRRRGLTRFMEEDKVNVLKYLDHLEGRARYVLSIEPENRQFRETVEKLAAFRRQYVKENFSTLLWFDGELYPDYGDYYPYYKEESER